MKIAKKQIEEIKSTYTFRELEIIIDKVEKLVNVSDKYSKSFFWTPSENRKTRELEMVENSILGFSWIDGKNHYYCWYNVDISCSHYYCKGYYYKNCKKTTLRAIRSSLAVLKEIYSILSVDK